MRQIKDDGDDLTRFNCVISSLSHVSLRTVVSCNQGKMMAYALMMEQETSFQIGQQTLV